MKDRTNKDYVSLGLPLEMWPIWRDRLWIIKGDFEEVFT